LPWLTLTVIAAARSWSAGAVAAVLFAAIAASAPSLVPALVVLLVVWMAVNPSRVHRLVGIVIPAAALFAPLVYEQVRRGTPLDLLADPGLPVASKSASALQLALGSTDASASGWSALRSVSGLAITGPTVYAILLIPLVGLALAAAFVPGSSRGIPAIVVALLGFGTAVLATGLSLTTSGSSAVTVWPGAGLSLMWLGLTGALVVTLESFGRGAALPALVVALASTIAVAPFLVAPLAGTAPAQASTGDVLPAYVDAVGAAKPNVGTLVLTAEPGGALAAAVQRGSGDTLDDQSTFAATANTLDPGRKAVLTLAGNLASRSGLDTTGTMKADRIGFVLLRNAPASAGSEVQVVQDRALSALGGNPTLALVGTTPQGLLWKYGSLPDAGLKAANPDGGATRTWILSGLGVVFLITLLLAVPIRGGRRRTSIATITDERATLGEDDDA
jgi:hypothetical protein